MNHINTYMIQCKLQLCKMRQNWSVTLNEWSHITTTYPETWFLWILILFSWSQDWLFHHRSATFTLIKLKIKISSSILTAQGVQAELQMHCPLLIPGYYLIGFCILLSGNLLAGFFDTNKKHFECFVLNMQCQALQTSTWPHCQKTTNRVTPHSTEHQTIISSGVV